MVPCLLKKLHQVSVSQIHRAELEPNAVILALVVQFLQATLVELTDRGHIFLCFLNLNLSRLHQVNFFESGQENLLRNPADAGSQINSRVEATDLIFELIEHLVRRLTVGLMNLGVASEDPIDRRRL